LEGVLVRERASYVAGPYAGGLLADLGAEVVKLETPPHGDPYRGWGRGNYSTVFCSLNRNKKSIVVDLRTPNGRALAQRIAEQADVLIENSRPGAMERLGLGYESLRQVNPRLVYCSITGFGQSGPYSDRPGYDTVGQAASGLLSLLTNLEAPQPMGVSLSDHLGGLFGCYGILAALAARERTGRGQLVDTSLLRASLSFLSENVTRFVNEGGKSPTRATRTHSAQVYAFRDAEGWPFVIHLSSPPKFWQSLAEAVGRSELIDDPRFASREDRIKHHDELQAILDAIFATGTRDQWIGRLQAADVPCAPLNTLADVVADPQVRHLEMIQTVRHPEQGEMRLVGSGIALSETPTTIGPAPVANEHAAEILTRFGFPPDFLNPSAVASSSTGNGRS
jgi:formyl-CoA transferase